MFSTTNQYLRRLWPPFFLLTMLIVSCSSDNNAVQKKDFSETSSSEAEVSEHVYQFHTASGQNADAFKMDITVFTQEKMMLIHHGEFTDTCTYETIEPKLIFTSSKRGETFTWGSKKKGDLWEIRPVDGVVITLRKS
jgi:hypothetical protein